MQIALSEVAVEFGANVILSDVTFTIAAGERWGMVGRNGTGKTSLLRLMTGDLAPTRGQVARPSTLRIALLEQHRDFAGAGTVWEAAAGPFAELLALEQSLARQARSLEIDASEDALTRYGHDLERFEREGGYLVAPRVDAVLHGLGFDPTEARTRAVATLSGGERGRVGLARQLVAPADVLLLDEPTNHLDLETIDWLEQYLAATDETVIVVSHDRAFLAAIADHVLHLEGGTAVPYVGGYEAFVEQRTLRRLTRERAVAKQQRTIAAEEDYIKRNIAGQNSKQAKGRRKRLGRLPRLSPPVGAEDAMALRLDVAERGGDQVLVADAASIGVDDRVLIEPFAARVLRGERVGVVGANGTGKSTLLRSIVGDAPTRSGELRLGGSITVAHYRQDLAQVPMGRSLYDVINDLRPLWSRGQIQSHLARFGFGGDEVQRRADTLSGGERARVALAMMMLSRANLLILDEPTNHLDVESIEALEDAIESYPGTVLLVSHDRALMRALATRVWVLHDRRLTPFDGSFGEWEVVSAERAHAAEVAAAEEEAIRRVREHRATARRAATSAQTRTSAARRSSRTIEAIEADVATAESVVERLTHLLADPSLYTTPKSVDAANALGAELDAAKARLDRAIAEWERALDSE